MRVEFSELALAGLARVMPEPDRREGMRRSIIFFLRAPDADWRAILLPAFSDKDIYLQPLDRIRVMYERLREHELAYVWSITPAKPDFE